MPRSHGAMNLTFVDFAYSRVDSGQDSIEKSSR